MDQRIESEIMDQRAEMENRFPCEQREHNTIKLIFTNTNYTHV